MKKKGRSFEEECYFFLKKVPKGKVTTYKDLAKAINSKAYRAVGALAPCGTFGIFTKTIKNIFFYIKI